LRYQLLIKPKAEKQLNKIPFREREKILDKFAELQENPFLHGVEKLHGIEGYRLRIGNYRALFSFDKLSKEILIFRVKHRKEAYRF
jgi:mRNA interferase RelE/StbE